jgi:hypothetical protein
MVSGGKIECLECPATFASINDLPPLVNPAAPTFKHAPPVTGRAAITDAGRAALREPLPGPVDTPHPPGWDKAIA